MSLPDESAGVSPASEASLGICTLSRGLLASEPKVLDRAVFGTDGIVADGSEDVELVRGGINGGGYCDCGGMAEAPRGEEAPDLSCEMAPTSTECDRALGGSW